MAIPIMLMIRQLDLGGTERQMSELARGLDRSLFEVHVGCFHSEGTFGDELRAAGVPVEVFPVRSFWHPSAITHARQMARYLRRHRIRLVHTLDVPATVFGVPVARMSGVPRVLSSQRAQRRLTRGLLRHLLRLTDRMVDGVVANCEFIRNELIQQDKLPARMVWVCRNGVDLGRYSPSNRVRPRQLGDASLVIGTVGAMRPEKAQSLLLEAFAECLRADPHLKLVLVGAGPLEDALRCRAAQLGLGDRSLILPASPRVEDWLRGMDIFVLPSLSEALSNALMEAMACGCSVVASAVGGNTELVRHGETGLLFRPGDAGDLAEKLASLVNQPALRLRLAAAGAESIRSYSTAESVRCMAQIYEKLL